jgi:hypothetical protein
MDQEIFFLAIRIRRKFRYDEKSSHSLKLDFTSVRQDGKHLVIGRMRMFSF